jgi:hypothetical protein
MSNNYLLISSAYRDRLLYPNPADFVVPYGTINNVNLNVFNVFSTTNPISAFPIYNFCWTNFFQKNSFVFPSKIVAGSKSLPIVDKNVNDELLRINYQSKNPFDFSQLIENCEDILNGLLLTIVIDSVRYTRSIQGYDPIKSEITLQNPFPFFTLEDGPIQCFIEHPLILFQEPELLLQNVVVLGPFLDTSGLSFYSSNLYIYNVTLNEIRKGINFNPDTNRLQLDAPFTKDYSVTNQFMVFPRSRPSLSGKMLPFDTGSLFHYMPDSLLWYQRGKGYRRTDTLVRLEGPNDKMYLDRPYKNPYYHIFRLNNVSFDGQVMDDDLELVSLGKQEFSIQKTYRIVPIDYIPDEIALVNIGSFSLAFRLQYSKETTPTANSNFLVGNYFFPIIMSNQYRDDGNTIYLQPNSCITVNNETNVPIDLLESQSIHGVTGIKKKYILNQKEIVIFTQTFSNLNKLVKLSQALRANQLPSFCQGADNFLILPYLMEGVVPLNYTGSQITNSQMSCYEMTITNLILPNRILQSVNGLLSSSYPFVFLEISNETMPSGGNTDVIYSNNPFSTKATFVCGISDVNNPETTRFIKISSDGSLQVIKFSPYDNLRFRISLPNGVTFVTEDKDFLLPIAPDPRLQITIFAQIRKL